jgi:hypothetical protein
VLPPYLKKLPIYAHAINVWFPAAVTLNNVVLVNSGTTWKTKYPWIQLSFTDGEISAGNLFTMQKNEMMAVTVTVQPLYDFPYIHITSDVPTHYCNKLVLLDVHVTVHHDKFLVIKPTRCTNFSNLFGNEPLHVSDSSSVHHQEFFTVNTAMIYVIQVYWQLESKIRMELQFHPDPARKLSGNLYDIYHCCAYSEKLLMMERGTVWTHRGSFPNKFEKLVHLVGLL